MARRAKKPKYKEFNTFSNTFEFNEDSKRQKYFADDSPLVLELGCGKAELGMFLARKYVDKNFIGIDRKADRLWRPAKEALAENIKNIAFLKMDMRLIDLAFYRYSVDEIWLTFSDPYPKVRQAKHRLTHPLYLEKYKKILKPNGHIYIKTDNLTLFQWSLEQFSEDKNLVIEKIVFDLHGAEQMSEDVLAKTFYESKYIKEGKKIKYCRLRLT